jgi:drug/metabolite transporter (DMT)-like permease
MVLGMLLAFTASALFNIAVVVQALDARTVPSEHSLRLSLLSQLFRRRRWRIGLLLALIGWPFHAAALLLAPLTAVQPALAAGLLLLLVVASRTLHERVTARDVAGVVAIVVGEALLAWAAPERHAHHTEGPALVLVLMALGGVALLPYLYRDRSRVSGLPSMMSAGVAFALSGFVTKLVSDDLSAHAWFSAWLWADLVGIAAVVGVLSENTALQTRPASQVAPLVFSAQTVLPVLLAPLLAGEGWSGTPLGGGVVVIALLIVTLGVVLLATSRAVDALIGHTAPLASEAEVSTSR